MATGPPANAIELRIHELLRPFRSEVHEVADTDNESDVRDIALRLERMMAVLCRESSEPPMIIFFG